MKQKPWTTEEHKAAVKLIDAYFKEGTGESLTENMQKSNPKWLWPWDRPGFQQKQNTPRKDYVEPECLHPANIPAITAPEFRQGDDSRKKQMEDMLKRLTNISDRIDKIEKEKK